MTKFLVKDGEPTRGHLVYDGTGFDTEPRPAGCVASVSIHELELMLDEEDQRVVFVTGYCPYQSWRAAELRPPQHHRAQLYAVTDKPIVAGTTVGLHPREESWPIVVDGTAGWIRLGKRNPDEDRDGIEFAPGALAILENKQLVALWLRPERLPANLAAAAHEALAEPNGAGAAPDRGCR